ncbi:MAG TPA: hypothetical protein DCQ98_10375 [Planctomycetaceae bacterium]|nr:hypothetical protein [Planctomycetaceae bacterium]
MSTCPDGERLKRFARGSLPDEAWDAVAAHLEGCDECRRRLDAVDTARLRPFGGQVDPLPSVGAVGDGSRYESSAGIGSTVEGGSIELAAEPIDPAAIRLLRQVATWVMPQGAGPRGETDQRPVDADSARPSSPIAVGAFAGRSPRPGDRLGQYRLLDEIGRGAMGIVYLAEHVSLRRQVAVKLIHPQREFGPDAVARFRREMSAVGRLDHPHLIRATDAGSIDGIEYLVMEYLAGIDVERLAKIFGPLPTGAACEIAAQAAAGLAHAHRAGLVHRDVKPSNLLMGADGAVRVLDLGLARPLDLARDLSIERREERPVDWELTSPAGRVGTRAYMAPEQYRSSRDVDQRSDIFGLGATLVRLLWGFPPSALHGSRDGQGIVLPEPRLRPDLDRELLALLERMTAAEPSRRLESMEQVEHELARFRSPTALFELLAQCRSKGLVPASPSVPIVHAASVPNSESRDAFAPQAMPQPFGAGDPDRGVHRGLILLGIGVSTFGMLLAAITSAVLLWQADPFGSRARLAQADDRALSRETGEATSNGSRATDDEDLSIAAARTLRDAPTVRLSGNSIEVLDTAYLFDGRHAFTIELWVRPDESPTRGIHDLTLLSAPSRDPIGGPFGRGWSLGTVSRAFRSEWALSVGGHPGMPTGMHQSALLHPGHWHHVALSHASGNWRLWLDGIPSTLNLPGPSGGLSEGAGNLQIGGWGHPISQGMHGRVGGFRITEGNRYSGTFEPPFPLVADDRTLCLLDLRPSPDEPGRLIDRTGWGRDGLMAVAAPNLGENPAPAPFVPSAADGTSENGSGGSSQPLATPPAPNGDVGRGS